jgi:hypothetical protein
MGRPPQARTGPNRARYGTFGFAFRSVCEITKQIGVLNWSFVIGNFPAGNRVMLRLAL